MLQADRTYWCQCSYIGQSERNDFHHSSHKQNVETGKTKYKVKAKNFSCHSLRKTFGRQVYNMNDNNSELALVKLMELFNHSSVAITKRYLGLRQEEILETYDCLSF